MEMKTTFIYGLIDPRTKEVRYIGKANKPEKRLYEHLRCKGNNKKANWIKKLISLNLKPILEIIDEIPFEEWQFWECHYISLYKSWGFRLKNGSDGGEGVDEIMAWKISQTLKGTKQSQETIDKRIESKRKYKEKTGSWAKKGTYEKIKATRIANNSYNTVWTEELRIKQSNSIKEAYKNGTKVLSGGCLMPRLGKLNGVSRAVVQYDLQGNKIKEFESAKQAGESLGLKGRNAGSAIISCCKERNNFSYKGYIWLYKESKTSSLDIVRKIGERKEEVKQNMKEKQKLRWHK